jgi:hypothetical protein
VSRPSPSCRTRCRRAPAFAFRPFVLPLEDRLQPGETLLGVLGAAAAAAAVQAPADPANPAAGVTLSQARPGAEPRVGTGLAAASDAPAPAAAAPAVPAGRTVSYQAAAGGGLLALALDVDLWSVPGLAGGSAPAHALTRVPAREAAPSSADGGGAAVAAPGHSDAGGGTSAAAGGPALSSSPPVPPAPGQRPGGGSGTRNIGPPPDLAVDVSPDCDELTKQLIQNAPGYGPGETPYVALPDVTSPNACPSQTQTLPGEPDDTPSVAAGLSYSEAPIRYFDGTMKLAFTDLESDGFGSRWGQTRNFTNEAALLSGSWDGNGQGIVVSQLPYLLMPDSDNVYAVASGVNSYHFTCAEFCSSYHPPAALWNQEQLAYSNHFFTVSDTEGNLLTFKDTGVFSSLRDRYGNTTSATDYDSTTGQVKEVQRSDSVTGVTESYLYHYIPSGTNAGKLDTVTLQRKQGSGSWATVRKVTYDYYDGSTGQHGVAGNLRSAAVSDGADHTLDVRYYRYWTDAWSSSAPGYAGGLKYAFEPDSYARLTAALGSSVDSLSDAQVAPYADYYFEYDSLQRVSKDPG